MQYILCHLWHILSLFIWWGQAPIIHSRTILTFFPNVLHPTSFKGLEHAKNVIYLFIPTSKCQYTYQKQAQKHTSNYCWHLFKQNLSKFYCHKGWRSNTAMRKWTQMPIQTYMYRLNSMPPSLGAASVTSQYCILLFITADLKVVTDWYVVHC
jgi:hypothetical protein